MRTVLWSSFWCDSLKSLEWELENETSLFSSMFSFSGYESSGSTFLFDDCTRTFLDEDLVLLVWDVSVFFA